MSRIVPFNRVYEPSTYKACSSITTTSAGVVTNAWDLTSPQYTTGTFETVTTWIDTPNFAALKAANAELPITDYCVTGYTYTVAGGSLHTASYSKTPTTPQKVHTVDYLGDITRFAWGVGVATSPAPVLDPPAVSENYYARAKQSCLAKVNTPGYSGGEDAVFYKETAKLLSNPLRELKDVMSRHQKLIKRAKNHALMERGSLERRSSVIRDHIHGSELVLGDLKTRKSYLQKMYEMYPTNANSKKLKLVEKQYTHERTLLSQRVTALGELKVKRAQLEETLTDTLAGFWLKFRFVYSQLVYTTVGVAEECARRTLGQEDVRVVRASDGYVEDLQSSVDCKHPSVLGYTWKQESTSRVCVKVQAGIRFRLKRAGDPDWDMAKSFGYRLSDMPRLGYDLLRLSFMFDRLFSAGKFLDGIQAFNTHEVEILGGWMTVTVEEDSSSHITNIQCNQAPKTNGSWLVCSGDGGLNSLKKKTTTRTPWIPQFVETFPVSQVKLFDDLQHQVDALSLLAVTWKSLKK